MNLIDYIIFLMWLSGLLFQIIAEFRLGQYLRAVNLDYRYPLRIKSLRKSNNAAHKKTAAQYKLRYFTGLALFFIGIILILLK